ncbi:MAG: hypothetical protein RBR68_06720 [Tenuifilaceae bacterium]|jgi:hypothetical protein|nr:hypothetical protein [Tenuifilaceae bacterium]
MQFRTAMKIFNLKYTDKLGQLGWMHRGLRNVLMGILGFLIIPFASFAQKPIHSFQAQVSADSILVGDQVELTIKAQMPNGYSVQFPIFADTLVTGIEVLDNGIIDTVRVDKENLEYTYRLRITSFDEGYYRIPPFQLPFSNGVMSDTAKTSPIWFLVNAIPADTTVVDIYDIKLPISEPITFRELAPWIGGGLLLIAIIAFIIYYISRRKNNKPLFFPIKPVEPAHIVALRNLNLIKDQKQWNTDKHKHYHTTLTNIIRQYIESRFDIYAMEQTTDEIIRSFRNENIISKELLNELSDNLSLSDLVKFARYTPMVSENEAGLNFGYKFVNQTKIEELVEGEVDSEDKPNGNEEEKNKKFVEPEKSGE